MRVAVVDIGSNSTRLYVAEIADGRVEAELEHISNVTRLGSGVDRDGRLAADAMERVYKVLGEYERLIESHGAERRIAVLTSAVRDASNGREFAEEVERRYGFRAHVLSGEEEANLTFLGATSARDPSDSTVTLVVDIGGGSTEYVIGSGREAEFHVSNQAGVVRQTERHIHDDPPPREELDALARDAREILAGGVPDARRAGVRHAIAVAGTATSLAAIAQDLDPYDPDQVEGYVLHRERCEEILARLAALPLSERREVRGLHPDRAPTIVAGAIILLETMSLFGLERVEVSEHDILRGAALGVGASS